jgi:hemerythrin superfamily protein
MLSADSGENWDTRGTDFMQIASDNREIYGFTKDLSNRVLSAESKINFKVTVEASINPTNDLNVTDEVTLDGLTNVELVYL